MQRALENRKQLQSSFYSKFEIKETLENVTCSKIIIGMYIKPVDKKVPARTINERTCHVGWKTE